MKHRTHPELFLLFGPAAATQSKHAAEAVRFALWLSTHCKQPEHELLLVLFMHDRQTSCWVAVGRELHAMQDAAPVPQNCTCTGTKQYCSQYAVLQLAWRSELKPDKGRNRLRWRANSTDRRNSTAMTGGTVCIVYYLHCWYCVGLLLSALQLVVSICKQTNSTAFIHTCMRHMRLLHQTLAEDLGSITSESTTQHNPLALRHTAATSKQAA